MFSTQVYQLLDCLGTLGSIVASGKPSERLVFAEEALRISKKDGNFQQSVCVFVPFLAPFICLAQPLKMRTINTQPRGGESRDDTCQPRSCFGFSPIANRNALKDAETRWLQIKEEQRGTQLLARSDRFDQVPAKIAHRIFYCRPSKPGIAARGETYAL